MHFVSLLFFFHAQTALVSSYGFVSSKRASITLFEGVEKQRLSFETDLLDRLWGLTGITFASRNHMRLDGQCL